MPEGKPDQAPLFPVYVTEKLKVSDSRRRMDKMARDASLDPDAHEARALKRKTELARNRGIIAAGIARLRNT